MKQRFASLALILLIGTLLGGCAVGNKYMIADVPAQFEATGNYSVVVASLDQRQFIVDETSPETYVGMVRGGYGNPFNATTISGLPFSDDVGQSICNALILKGFKATLVPVKFNLTEEMVFERLLSNKEDRALLVLIRKWESDSFLNLNVGYDLTLKVIAKDGTILATAHAKDDVHVPGNIWIGSLEMSKTEVPNIFRKSIESLMNNSDVVKVLANK
jgi:hypothetical protein